LYFREVDEVFEEELANTLEDYQDEEKHFVEKFENILKAMALPYNGSSLLDCDRRCQERLQRLPDSGEQSFEFFLAANLIAECLADFAAQSVQSIHKLGQLLLITETAVRQKTFSDFHDLIGRRISFYSDQFAQHISSVGVPGEETDELVTTVFLAAGDAFSYVQQSFRLLRPLLIL
uniref:Vacuolar protein sorting-associated protein 52 homolog n=1 Tax=Gongylonema pulchrum TaxID=637853 RepID=A0A183ECJ6_9BILA